MNKKWNKPVLLISCSIILALSGCDSNQLPKQLTLDSNYETKQTPSDKLKFDDSGTLPYQGDLLNVDGLLQQLDKADTNLEYHSKRLLKVASEAQADSDWGAAAKGFGESALFMPSNEALLGYALATIMTNVYTLDPEETLKTKLRNFQKAIKIYQVTTQFSQRASKPLSHQQIQLIQTNVACLESFLQSPDPNAKTCKLVTDALRVSQIK